MSGSTTNLDLISASQASKEVTANDLFDAASPATIYGRRATTTAALTWGFYGGTRVINGVATIIANGTIALTANLTNYVEANRATGAVTANTAGFTAGADPLYTVVAGAATVTSYTDNRTALLPVGFLSKSVAAGGTITLSNAESNNHLFEFTGVLPNNTTVVFPAIPARLQCENLTTGAFSLTIKTAAGTGIVIQQNSTLNLYCNGVNIEDSNSAKEDDLNRDASGGYVGKTLEKVNFWNTARTFMSFLVNAATAIRTYTFPDRDGTVALKDDAGMWSGTTGGSTTAYTLTPSPAIAAYADGQRFLFIAHATNTGAGATFAINGLAALPSTMGSVTMPIGGLLVNNKYWGLIEGTGTSIRIAPFDAVSSNGDTINGAAAFEVNGDALIIGTEASKVREGSWATASGALYTLLGETAAWYRTHNTALTVAGDFAGRDDAGICQLFALGESGREYKYEAVTGNAGVVPTFTLVSVDLKGQIANDTNAKGYSQAVNTTAATAGSSGLYTAHTAQIDQPTNNFTITWLGSAKNWVPGGASNLALVELLGVAPNYGVVFLLTLTGSMGLNLYNNAVAFFTGQSLALNFVDGSVHRLSVTVVRETATVAGSVTFYIDGLPFGAPLVIAASGLTTTGGAGRYLSVQGRATAGIGASARHAGTLQEAGLFNRDLSAAEHLALYRNGLSFSDMWGSQTLKNVSTMLLGTYPTGSGYSATAGNWSTTATAGIKYGGSTAEMVFALGKKYVVEFIFALNSGALPTLNLAASLGGAVSSTAQNVAVGKNTLTFECTVAVATGVVEFITAATTASDFSVTGIVIKDGGAVAYYMPETIQYDEWYDVSPYAHNLTYPATGYSFLRPVVDAGYTDTPFAGTGTATLAIGSLLKGLLTDTHATAATATYTLPLATSIDAIPSWPIGRGIEWSFTNLSAAAADTATIAANTGHTVVGNMVIQSANAATGALYGNTRRFLTKKTAISAAGVGTYITYAYGG